MLAFANTLGRLSEYGKWVYGFAVLIPNKRKKDKQFIFNLFRVESL